MTKHHFGGDWTTEKLDRVRKYLCEYVKIFDVNEKARFYSTTYVDAFAGTGDRFEQKSDSEDGDLFGSTIDTDRESLKKGSTRIALEITPSFDQYIFVEQNPVHVAELTKLASEFPEKKPKIEQGEANDFLHRWCKATNWKRNRAVVFLDPYGMQVDWTTIQTIAGTKAIDLWILFPLGVAVNRLLTRTGQPPAEWGQALTRCFGNEEWREVFYKKREVATLFDDKEIIEERNVSLNDVGQYFVDRLRSVFAGVAPNPLPLANSKGQPIYLLCFAAGNSKGAPIAVRIAQHVLRP